MDETSSQLEFEADDKGEEYKIKGIWDSAIYTRELRGYLSELYYLVSWQGYPKEENIWEPALAVQHL